MGARARACVCVCVCVCVAITSIIDDSKSRGCVGYTITEIPTANKRSLARIEHTNGGTNQVRY
jgi:hypothetical protein